jgi:PPK2 family polyphosphate:nucleotide phosphotransferase
MPFKPAETFRVPYAKQPGKPDKSFKLNLPTDASDAKLDKDAAKAETREHVEALQELQNKFYADGSKSLLVLLQAIDAGGKDSTVRRCFGEMNPAGVRVWSFKKPTELEMSHDFLWRHHQRCPRGGMISVHNRSHYEAVLVERVKNIVPKKIWSKRYEQIAHFESMLAAENTIVLKIFLNLSPEEQAERFIDRLDDPRKWWKFSAADLDERERWHDYQAAFRDALSATSTKAAPWYAIPADQKWYRDYLVTGLVRDTLRAAKSEYPAPADGLENEVDTFRRRLAEPLEQ